MAKKGRKRNRRERQQGRGGKHTDSQRRASSYRNVIEHGRELAAQFEDNWGGLTDRQQLIFDYYARVDIQDAMYAYGQGRKITVLRLFRPLYNRIEAPEHILYMALYHSEERGMWPSLHSMISRYTEEADGHVCDFVVEVDYKRSWKACFDATLPYIQVLRDFGIYARIKFSGHVSAHVIVPGETFPPDVGDARKLLMDYAQKVVKHPDKLDRYFLQSSHFLRMPYSLNERTGLVSLPIMMDQFEGFSWRHAQANRVEVLRDWFKPPPEGAQERVREFVRFAERRYHLMRQEEAAEQRRRMRERRQRAAVGRGKLGGAPHAAEPLISDGGYEQMLNEAQEEWAWCEGFLEQREALGEALSELQASSGGGVISLSDLAEENGCALGDLWRIWRWLNHAPDLEYYAEQEIQEAIFEACASRRLKLWAGGGEFELKGPEDVYPLAVFHQKSLGAHEHPGFLTSVARFEPDLQIPVGYDLVIEVDGRGRDASAAQVAAEVGRALSSQELQFTAYHAGVPCIYLWVEAPFAEEEPAPGDVPQLYAAIGEGIRKHMRQAGFVQEQWRVMKRDGFVPAPGSLNLYTGEVVKRA